MPLKYSQSHQSQSIKLNTSFTYFFLLPLSTPPFTMLMQLALSIRNFLNKFLYWFKMAPVIRISSYLIKIDYIANPNMANNQSPCVGCVVPVASIDSTDTLAHENLCCNQNNIVRAMQQSTHQQPAPCGRSQQTSECT